MCLYFFSNIVVVTDELRYIENKLRDTYAFVFFGFIGPYMIYVDESVYVYVYIIGKKPVQMACNFSFNGSSTETTTITR